MLIRKDSFENVLKAINDSPYLSADVESTGLYSYLGDSLFSIIIATAHDSFYFNFKDYDHSPGLSRDLIPRLNEIKDKTIFMANAKFDLGMLAKEGCHLVDNNKIWDVLTVAKCLNNTHITGYSLDLVAKRMGYEKLKTVEEYIKKFKLYSKDESGTRKPRYDWVPLSIVQEYGEKDGRITYDIGVKQMGEVDALDDFSAVHGFAPFADLIEREMKVTEVCYAIEKHGMAINKRHISDALAHEQARAMVASQSFKEISNLDFVDSNKSLEKAFTSLGVSGGVTKKGNASFTDDVLSQITHPLGQTVREYRDATKRANTYFRNFLSFADQDGIIHPNIRQAGADTFRFSITDPALQTLNAEENGDFKVRDSFVSREGFSLVSIDYSQQEYRLTADYAGEHDLIRQIKQGADVHEATAKLMGVTRTQAKTLNFMLLYGGGVAKLCLALFKPVLNEIKLKAVTWKYIYKSLPKDTGQKIEIQKALETITQEEINHDLPLLKQAHELQQKYFSALPKTKKLIDDVTNKAKDRGYIYNFAGRRLLFPDKRFAYKAPNHLIQSSGAEIMRIAMCSIHDFLKPHRSKMTLSIHDEILLEMPREEFDLIPKIREIMVNAYKPFNGLNMDTSVEVGQSWGSMREYKDGTETRDVI